MRKLLALMCGLIICLTALSQRKKKEDLSLYLEFAKLSQFYKALPVQLRLQIKNSTFPATTEGSKQSEMLLYFGKKDFYIRSEGLEQIVNDSLVIMVNTVSKQILVYPNENNLLNSIERSISLFKPDSSIESLSRRFLLSSEQTEENIKTIVLQGREIIRGTNLSKESFRVSFRPYSYQPVEFSQVNRRMVPVDPARYNSLNNVANTGRLISAKTENGDLFFLVQETTTSYVFESIMYDVIVSPVKEQDRVVKGENGDYQPAKGFEEYIVSKQF